MLQPGNLMPDRLISIFVSKAVIRLPGYQLAYSRISDYQAKDVSLIPCYPDDSDALRPDTVGA